MPISHNSFITMQSEYMFDDGFNYDVRFNTQSHDVMRCIRPMLRRYLIRVHELEKQRALAAEHWIAMVSSFTPPMLGSVCWCLLLTQVLWLFFFSPAHMGECFCFAIAFFTAENEEWNETERKETTQRRASWYHSKVIKQCCTEQTFSRRLEWILSTSLKKESKIYNTK